MPVSGSISCPLALGRDRARDADVRDRRREAAGRDRTSGASARGRAGLLVVPHVFQAVLPPIRPLRLGRMSPMSRSAGLSLAPYPQPGADEGREAPPQARCCSWFVERDTEATSTLATRPLVETGPRACRSGERDCGDAWCYSAGARTAEGSATWAKMTAMMRWWKSG
jgi:hypothetical protein